MKPLRIALVTGVLVAAGFAAAYGLAQTGGTTGTATFTNVVTYTIPTVTETVTVTVPTEPPPLPPPPPPPPDPACTVELQPGNSITNALASVPAGSTVCLHAGVYNENVSYSRNAVSFITLQPFTAEAVTVRSVSIYTIRANNGSARLRIQGLRVTSGACNCPAAGGVIDLYTGPHEVIGNEVTGSSDNGIYTDDFSQSILIRGNHIHDNGTVIDGNQDHGIYLQGAGHLVEANTIENHPQGFGVQIGDRGSNPRVLDNTISNSGNGRPCCGGIVAWSSGMTGVRIDGNRITGSRNWAIENNGVSSCVSVSFNLLGGDGMESFPCVMEGNQ